MASRLELHDRLLKLADNVYYQPPSNGEMNYPAIKYSREDIRNTHADDEVYTQSNMYMVTVIDEDPDSEIVEKLSKFPRCRFVRHYVSDNLNHDVFTIQY